jgi:nucleotide-binding universal stress UspA family protein
MSYTHVLAGTDGSATAARAVDAASRVAASLALPLVVVTAWQRDQTDPPAPSEEARYPGGSAAAMDAQWAIETTSDAAAARTEDRGREVLERAVDRDPDVADLPRRVVVDGDPVRALGTAAADHDLLVIGNKGMSGPSRLLGSVSNRLTHEVPTDLLLVNTTR